MADGSRFFDHGHGHGHGAHLCLSVGRSLSPLLEGRGTNDVSVFVGILAAPICCIEFDSWYVRHMRCLRIVTRSPV